MDVRVMGFDNPFFQGIHQELLDHLNPREDEGPTSTYVRDVKAMASTPAGVKEYPNSYVFIIDMPALKSSDIKVQVEDDNVLVISGERKRKEDKEGEGKYLRVERRVGKLMRKFMLPENADTDSISARLSGWGADCDCEEAAATGTQETQDH